MARIAGESPRTARHVRISPGTVADPVVLCCEIAGGGPPVMLIHGLGDSIWVWRNLIPTLSPRSRVLALELRGHGRSSSPHESFTAADMASDIHRLSEELSAKRPLLIAQGFGARLALLLAVEKPEFPSALVLIGANTGPPNAAAISAMKNHVLAGEMSAAYKAKRDIIPPPRGMSPQERAEHHRLFMRNNPAGLAAALAAAEEAPNLIERFGDIECPTLAVAGEFDEPRIKALEGMAANMHNCTAAIIEGSGHYPQLDSPEAFETVLLDFLENLGLIDPRQ
ncbi:MAG: alpha/beta hydrolase [Nitrospinaceae bacterium]|jgi:3-oxoadipate enol-lactonase|nr:alpha/beta hydrolase [Nitrospinaceae bacterium]MBT3433045.1 alpha/beta hydrolase [Nitrospinaceae bacterium]MBT4092361.1 alpha/beta hydrolase [Nitrospinaceae bacterium]MBT4428970.1 alpha/beta hydrolase [Nitrospinaceae bacterium]MBT5369403.1 alpha/beta hydrolase [Nitrospinaceae bacterium]